MLYENAVINILWIIVLASYVLIYTYFSKNIYELMLKRDITDKDAIYYNRKLVHIFAGGVTALFVPIVFTSSIYPLLCSIAISIFTYLSHKKEKKLYWFQMNDNINDVTFCLMWGFSIFILWVVIGNPWIAIIPSIFMSFGDGITGIVRNAMFKKRTKHPIGNVYMALVSIPFGYFLGYLGNMAFIGVFAALVAAALERYEFGPVDDNVLIVIGSSIVLIIGNFFI